MQRGVIARECKRADMIDNQSLESIYFAITEAKTGGADE
jgi:hypothetical protein